MGAGAVDTVGLEWLDRLATSGAGISCLYGLLDDIVAQHDLDDAILVVVDPELGRQALRAGRRPIDAGWALEVTVDGPEGLHTRPELTDDPGRGVLALATVVLRMVVLRHRSLTDVLTGLFDRGGFEEQFHAAVDRANRYGRSLTLALLDLDGFKTVNDRHGHATGDEVLRHVGRSLRRLSRGGDIAGRLGGDEFALLLPETSPAEAERVISRVRAHLANGDPPVRVSAGLARCPADGRDVTTLLRAADVELYADKSRSVR